MNSLSYYPNVRAILADVARSLRDVPTSALSPRQRNRAIRSHVRTFAESIAFRENRERAERSPWHVEASARAIADTFGIPLEEARNVRAILLRGPDPDAIGHPSHAIAEWMDDVSERLPGTFGAEFADRFAFVNRGDTYDRTIVADPETLRVSLGSWGDSLEEAEAAEADERGGAIRCGYCGEWIDSDGRDPSTWRTWECATCGNRASGS